MSAANLFYFYYLCVVKPFCYTDSKNKELFHAELSIYGTKVMT